MPTWLTIALAILAIYIVFKIGEVVLKIVLGLIAVGLIIYAVASLTGLDIWGYLFALFGRL